MNWKSVSLVTIFLILSMVLAACSNEDTPPAGDATPEEPPTAEPISPQLPDGVQGEIVPLPTGEEKAQAQEALLSAMADSGIDVERYDLDLIALSFDRTFYSAPVAEGYEEFPEGEFVGAWWDVEDAYGYGSLVYELTFSGDSVYFVNSEFGIEFEEAASFAEQNTSYDPTIAFYVEGSCYGCFCKDGRCCCLVCRR